MDSKEVDNSLGVYSVSIRYPNNTVDILDEYCQGIFSKIPPHKAVQICDLHNTFRRKVYEILVDI